MHTRSLDLGKDTKRKFPFQAAILQMDAEGDSLEAGAQVSFAEVMRCVQAGIPVPGTISVQVDVHDSLV